MRWALWISEGVVAATIVGVALYIGFSYLLTAAYVPKRPLGETFGALLRETFLAFVVTALLPLYMAFGRRSGNGSQPIIFVHGYAQNRVDFLYLAAALRKRGLGPTYGFNYFSLGDIRNNGEHLARFIDEVREETGASSVDLVCHSMGGLVARHCIRLDASRVRKCVTIASPHSGVRFRGPVVGRGGRQLRASAKFIKELAQTPLAVPTLSIFSVHDNVACPGERVSSLRLLGGQDLAFEHLGHLAILFDAEVAEATAGFLAD